MDTVPQYGRWIEEFDEDTGIDRVRFTNPDGGVSWRPAYRHQPAELEYDRHGYESVVSRGNELLAVRFTPDQPGAVQWEACRGEDIVQEGSFKCVESDHPGYVEVSSRDPRYFAFTDGSSYCPIGVNLCWPVYDRLPTGGEFDTSKRRGSQGVKDYERWFADMARNGGNYTRLWLSSPILNTETERAGVTDPAAFARLDAIVELARQYGIRLKMCLEHFRRIGSGSPYHESRVSHPGFRRTLRHPDGSSGPDHIDEWFAEEKWRELWLRKVDAYMARYGDDPVIMSWELWNEINACKISDWDIQNSWTRRMLQEVKKRSSRNLVVNSLGSFDTESKMAKYRDFHMEEMDFQQVHRYLDQGTQLDICHKDPVALSIDAVQRARREDRPVILTETGAVNDNHTGRFRYYRVDQRGTLLHDVTMPPFFAGAAGSGHSWFWEHYVEQKDLWHHLAPLKQLIEGIQLDGEGFEPVDLSTCRAWILALNGRRHVLLWIRNKSDRWDKTYRDGEMPEPLPPMDLELVELGVEEGQASFVQAWPEDPVPAQMEPVCDGTLRLPGVRFGCLARVRREDVY